MRDDQIISVSHISDWKGLLPCQAPLTPTNHSSAWVSERCRQKPQQEELIKMLVFLPLQNATVIFRYLYHTFLPNGDPKWYITTFCPPPFYLHGDPVR